MTGELSDEYRIVAHRPKRPDQWVALGETFATREEVDAKFAYVTGPWLEEIKAMAAEEQRKDDEQAYSGGNQYRHKLWELEDTTYEIVHRQVTPWEPA